MSAPVGGETGQPTWPLGLPGPPRPSYQGGPDSMALSNQC